MRFRWLWRVGALCVAGALCALLYARRAPGADAQGARLLEVSGIAPRVLERGEVLRISGAGFAPGRSAQVVLRGVLHRAGARPLAVRATLAGEAVQSDRIEVVLDDAALARLGGAGSFEGTLEVAFAARAGHAWVTGSARVGFDVLASRHVLRVQAERLLASVGLLAADTDMLHGLRIAEVRAGGLASRAGLLAGDVITSAAGVRVHALSDLAPRAGATRHSLRIERSGVHDLLAIELPLTAAPEATRGLPSGGTLRTYALLSFVALVLLFASPLPSPTPWVARAWQASSELGLTRVVRELGLALGPVALVALSLAGGWPLDAGYLLFACVALGVTLAAVRARAERDASALARAVCHALALAVITGCACALAGTRSLAGIVAAQGVAPFSWRAFTHPALGLGALLFVAHAARMLPQRPDGGSLAQLSSASLTGLLSLLAASLFFGGHAVAAAPLDPLWLGSAWLVLKTGVVMLGVALARRLAQRAPSRVRQDFAWLALAVVGSALQLALAASRSTELSIGAVLGSTTMVALALAALEVFVHRRALARAQASLASPRLGVVFGERGEEAVEPPRACGVEPAEA